MYYTQGKITHLTLNTVLHIAYLLLHEAAIKFNIHKCWSKLVKSEFLMQFWADLHILIQICNILEVVKLIIATCISLTNFLCKLQNYKSGTSRLFWKVSFRKSPESTFKVHI